MILLIFFSFLAGIVTILSPCILPILPIVLSGGIVSGKKRPLGIILGFILSFTFFTLFLTAIVKATGIPSDTLRIISVIIILAFGASLLIPYFQTLLEKLFTKLSGAVSIKNTNEGFLPGVLIGLSIGLVWTPCVGPILASVITLAATESITLNAFFITFAYSAGTAIPMFLIMLGGRSLLAKIPWLLPNTQKIQRVFGVLMILTALAIYFNIDRKFQAYILEVFPQYGAGLTKFEDNTAVKNQLEKLKPSKDKKGLFDDIFEQVYPSAPELIPGGEWFNSKPLKLSELRGKVVLIDFWTYTCINCIRTLPYLKSWHEKYSGSGLVIIGVHTTEFEFEKNPRNVKEAIEYFKIKYPVMQDNNYATWRAYNNRYWPAKYFIDKDGKIRSTHFGEGAYDESEEFIQKLLEELGSDISKSVKNPQYNIYSKTPETYLGYQRIENFASKEPIKKDIEQTYSFPSKLDNNQIAYSGVWTVSLERALPQKNSSLEINFEAKEVFLVMRSKNKEAGRVKVLIDNKTTEQNTEGDDVVDGVVEARADRLYKLIKLQNPGRHILKLEFQDDNLELYAFTFG